MRFLFALCLFAITATASSHEERVEKPTVIAVVGAAGEEEFAKEFIESARHWQNACATGGVNFIGIGLTNGSSTNDVEVLQQALQKEPTNSAGELWLVFLGHGTWDGKEAKFNLRGPDLSASDLVKQLAPFTRPIAIINSASASAPFIKALSHSNRVVITSTRSGAEENYTRFGRYISESIASPSADLDKDGQTSLLEAFLIASRRVTEFYKTEGRLATEHALIDDNGDGLGTPVDWFRGVRAVKTPSAGTSIDGVRAHQWHLVRSASEQALDPEQRRKRDTVEVEINSLRRRKSELKEDDYYKELERLLTELAPLIDLR
ncbi:MAG TPA: hypothetical protein VK530_11625 [Candidatus Acidoferrum sp.]|nr:hypothetical protein [Candidatus Acidoferrum sp.]